MQIRSAEAVITVTKTFTSLTYDGRIVAPTMLNYTDVWVSQTGFAVSYRERFDIGQGKDVFSYFFIYRGFVYFDTSIVPSQCNIITATLSLYIHSNNTITDCNITIQNGQPNYPRIPLVENDYYKEFYQGNGGSRNTSTITEYNYWNITLNFDGRSWIEKDGITKFCLRSNRDIDGVQPTDYEYITIYASEQGEAFAPKLYVTYETEGYSYIVYGPYVENNGAVYNGIVNVSLSKRYEPTYNFILNGSDSAADSVTFNVEQQPIAFTWNITTANNKTRTIYLTDQTFEEIYIYVPSLDEPYYLYTFTINDLAGMNKAYLETLISMDGQQRVVERQSLSVVNAVPFWMIWAHHYTLKIKCNLGTYTFPEFIALCESEQSLIVTRTMFPLGIAVEFDIKKVVKRLSDSWIQINYTDNAQRTTWVHILIKHKEGYTYKTDYETNITSNPNTISVDWKNATATINYVVEMMVKQDGVIWGPWTFQAPALPKLESPWKGLLEVFGIWPVPAEYIAGIGILLCVAGVFSYASTSAGVLSTVLVAAILTYMGWLNISWLLIGLGMVLAIMVAISEGKKRLIET